VHFNVQLPSGDYSMQHYSVSLEYKSYGKMDEEESARNNGIVKLSSHMLHNALIHGRKSVNQQLH